VTEQQLVLEFDAALLVLIFAMFVTIFACAARRSFTGVRFGFWRSEANVESYIQLEAQSLEVQWPTHEGLFSRVANMARIGGLLSKATATLANAKAKLLPPSHVPAKQRTPTVALASLSHDYDRVIDLFRRLDADGSNAITRDEFRAGVGMLGSVDLDIPPLTEPEIDGIFRLIDHNSSGDISYVELNAALRQGQAVELPPELKPGGVGPITLKALNKTKLRHGLQPAATSPSSAPKPAANPPPLPAEAPAIPNPVGDAKAEADVRGEAAREEAEAARKVAAVVANAQREEGMHSKAEAEAAAKAKAKAERVVQEKVWRAEEAARGCASSRAWDVALASPLERMAISQDLQLSAGKRAAALAMRRVRNVLSSRREAQSLLQRTLDALPVNGHAAIKDPIPHFPVRDPTSPRTLAEPGVVSVSAKPYRMCTALYSKSSGKGPVDVVSSSLEGSAIVGKRTPRVPRAMGNVFGAHRSTSPEPADTYASSASGNKALQPRSRTIVTSGAHSKQREQILAAAATPEATPAATPALALALDDACTAYACAAPPLLGTTGTTASVTGADTRAAVGAVVSAVVGVAASGTDGKASSRAGGGDGGGGKGGDIGGRSGGGGGKGGDSGGGSCGSCGSGGGNGSQSKTVISSSCTKKGARLSTVVSAPMTTLTTAGKTTP